jgi:serine phosphatase RsbU (regulator of sigma subunit)
MEVELKNEEVTHQKELVEEKQKEIIDSINYAKRIQQAVLTGEDVWKKVSKEHFILFKPKDIVSGDFYWAYNTPNNRSVFALADCTGHGVPGGFMSMLGNSFLNEIVVENKIFKADEILNKLRSKIIQALEQKGGTQQKDGMDISLCVWNKLDNTLEFAGANNPLWLVRKNENAVTELVEVKADKMPIGTYLENEVPFSSTTIQLQKGDIIFLCTDGYADQFGGPKGKKYKYKPLIDSLIKNYNLSMEEQKVAAEIAFNDWKNHHEQVDDVSLIGVRV